MEDDEDFQDEEMDSEEEKDDRPSLGIEAHPVAESNFAQPDAMDGFNKLAQDMLKGESPEEKEKRLAEEAANKKKKIGELAKKLFQRLSSGCERAICFSRFCRKSIQTIENAEWVKLTKDQKKLLTWCLQTVPAILDQENTFCDGKGCCVDASNVEALNEKQVTDLFDDAASFVAAFTKPKD